MCLGGTSEWQAQGDAVNEQWRATVTPLAAARPAPQPGQAGSPRSPQRDAMASLRGQLVPLSRMREQVRVERGQGGANLVQGARLPRGEGGLE
eukprot:scaffold43403_cov69-Phaeocystis_antarctica.AAC.1